MTDLPPHPGRPPTAPPDPDPTRYSNGRDRKLGRPLKLTTTITVVDPDGSPVRRTVHDAICDHMRRTGLPALTSADAVAGCGRAAKDWLAEARKLDAKPLAYPGYRQQVVLAFLYGTQRAHAEWVAEQEQIVASLAAGGLSQVETTLKVDPSRRDANGQPVVLERSVKEKRTLPDLAAVTFRLKHLARDHDGRRLYADRVEVTGADGGPIEVSDEETRARALIAQLDAYEQGMADRAEADADLAAGSGVAGESPTAP